MYVLYCCHNKTLLPNNNNYKKTSEKQRKINSVKARVRSRALFLAPWLFTHAVKKVHLGALSLSLFPAHFTNSQYKTTQTW